ncbi:MAG: HesA/MoeB/ThiF family protein [Casimicrobiaceae bacterium]
MDDLQLLRYSRHILLDELGTEAQAKFRSARALIVGVGGLGAPAAQFLAAAGIGSLTLCDDDQVDLTNLQRQILFATPDVGAPKVDAAAARLAAVNPDVAITRIASRVGDDELASLVAKADVVVDCCDNFETRHAVNRACVTYAKPLVSGAAIRFDGQIAVFDLADPESPCYHCLFGEGDELEETRCATMGVFAPLVGIVGSTQAAEALKLVAGAGMTLAGRLLVIDALAMHWRELTVPRDPECPVCRERPAAGGQRGAALIARSHAATSPSFARAATHRS